LKQLLSKGLEQTAALWSPIIIAYDWVHHAAKILANHAQFDSSIVQLCLSALTEAMSVNQTSAGSLLEGVIHFLKVTASYWSGLFYCYSVPGLPRTNNDLEHIFGIVRHHHRRCTGHKVAPSSVVLRGSVQLIACVATQLTTWCAEQLAAVSVNDWRSLRSQLEQHRINRVEQLRFRRSPADYLANLESQLL
jgi:hypothetical protein